MSVRITEPDAVRREMTMQEIEDLPNMLGKIASAQCKFHGEYKYRELHSNGAEIKTHIVLIDG